LRLEAEDSAARSRLPERVDLLAISELIANVYLTAWKK